MVTGIILNNKTIVEIPDHPDCEQIKNICEILQFSDQESQFIKNLNHLNDKHNKINHPSEKSFDVLMKLCVILMILTLIASI